MTQNNEDKVFTWTCPKCGKVIKSLYEKQLEEFKKVHMITKHGGYND